MASYTVIESGEKYKVHKKDCPVLMKNFITGRTVKGMQADENVKKYWYWSYCGKCLPNGGAL